ncbi:MAG: MazG nucleotide pyrophosphohydrolase domain-containing protein [Candidatus Shapirobacteria bacterium]|nr:MazG nucleotide pyrophosphohydrolase domain-containing protein [Candidatus Shapirobacteria bacterium]
MDLNEAISKAVLLRNDFLKYEMKNYGKNWDINNIAQGFVGDVGDLMKLILAKEGLRKIENVDEKIAHELADCLWSVLVITSFYKVDLESSYLKMINELTEFIKR